MKYFVTGATGQLGHDIVLTLKRRGEKEILAPDHSTVDITNKEQVLSYLRKEKPDVIFHCAAYTAVDKAEEETDTCFKVNVEGTKNIVEAAKEINAKLIYISTDYVFDGEKKGAYTEEDPCCPKSVYGKSKAQAEEVVKGYSKHFIVRISWVFGKNGKNFVKTMLHLAKSHKELRVVDDQVGSPTYTVDLSRFLLDLSETEKYGVYHATNEGGCSWYLFAKEILKEKDVIVHPVSTEDYQRLTGVRQAPRPKNSHLAKEKLKKSGFMPLPHWQDALSRFMEELEKDQ